MCHKKYQIVSFVIHLCRCVTNLRTKIKIVSQMVSQFIHVRDGKGFKVEIAELIRLLSEKEGRNVTETEIVLSALGYGLPLVRQEICSEIVAPSDKLPRLKQLAALAVQMVDIGFANSFPCESAS